MPNIEALRYLIELSRTNSINIAANNLYVSKSTISMAIKKLEQELGVVLLTRTHRGVLLTEDGQKVLALAEQIMALLNDISHISSEKVPSLIPECTHIYAIEDMLTTSIPALLKVFSTIFGKNFTLHNATSAEKLMTEIAQNTDRIGFLLSSQPLPTETTEYPQLQYHCLGQSYIHLTTAKNSQYLSERRPNLYTLTDIFQMPFIIRSSDTLINDIAKAYHLQTPPIAFIAPNNDTYWQAIADDLGVGFCVQNVNKFHFRSFSNLSTFPIKEKIFLYIYLAYHQDYPHTVIEHLVQALS